MKKYILILIFVLLLSTPVYAAKWLPLPDTDIQTKCPTTPAPSGTAMPSGYNFYTACSNVVTAYSGAVWDDENRSMYVFGGGHGNYYGNEIYKVDMSLASGVITTRITDPDTGFVNQAQDEGGSIICQDNVPGTNNPVSRHTYGHIQFIPALSSGLTDDMLWLYGGSQACGSGGFGTDTWLFNFNSETWSKITPSGTGPGNSYILHTAYHPTKNRIYFITSYGNSIRYYDIATNAWVSVYTFPTRIPDAGTYHNITIDTLNDDLYIIGGLGVSGGGLYKINLNGTPDYNWHLVSTTGATQIQYAPAPGFIYDSKRKLLAAWNGGSPSGTNYTDPTAVYTLGLDPAVPATYNIWTRTAIATDAPTLATSVPQGVYGRFAYSSKMDAYVVLGNALTNAVLWCPDNYPTDLWISHTLVNTAYANICKNGDCKHTRAELDPTSGLIYFFGGDHEGLSARSDVQTYNPDTDTWSLVVPNCATEGTVQLNGLDEGSLIYRAASSKFYYFYAGNYCSICRTTNTPHNGCQSPDILYDVSPCPYGACVNTAAMAMVEMGFSPSTNTWDGIPLGVSTTPANSSWGGKDDRRYGFYDITLDTVFQLVAGSTGFGVFKYSFITDEWTHTSTTGATNDFRYVGTTQPAQDKISRLVYLWDSNNNKLFSYNIATNALTLLSADAPRQFWEVLHNTSSGWTNPTMSWDSTNEILLLNHFQDNSDSEYWHAMEFHTYKPSTGIWQKNLSMNNWNGIQPAGRSNFYDSSRNIWIVFGQNHDRTYGNNQLWVYRYGGGAGAEPPIPPSTAGPPFSGIKSSGGSFR